MPTSKLVLPVSSRCGSVLQVIARQQHILSTTCSLCKMMQSCSAGTSRRLRLALCSPCGCQGFRLNRTWIMSSKTRCAIWAASRAKSHWTGAAVWALTFAPTAFWMHRSVSLSLWKIRLLARGGVRVPCSLQKLAHPRRYNHIGNGYGNGNVGNVFILFNGIC